MILKMLLIDSCCLKVITGLTCEERATIFESSGKALDVNFPCTDLFIREIILPSA